MFYFFKPLYQKLISISPIREKYSILVTGKKSDSILNQFNDFMKLFITPINENFGDSVKIKVDVNQNKIYIINNIGYNNCVTGVISFKDDSFNLSDGYYDYIILLNNISDLDSDFAKYLNVTLNKGYMSQNSTTLILC